MTDQWLDDGGLPIDDSWTETPPCAPASVTSSVDDILITGSPGSITSIQNDQSLWSLVLNDGTPECDFRIDRYWNGALVDSPITINRSTGAVMLNQDPTLPQQAVTKEYVDANAAGLTDAPNDGTLYARKSLAWAHIAHTDITDWVATLAPYALIASVPVASSTTPIVDGTGNAGVGSTFARNDHVHPTDTTRYAASNPAGYQTAAQVSAALAPYAYASTVLPLSGGTMTGPIKSVTGDSIDAPAGNGRAIYSSTNGVHRWQLNLANATAEGGANAGSDFHISAYDDTGATIGTPLLIARATGAVNINGVGASSYLSSITAGGAPLFINKASGAFSASVNGTMNGSRRWQLLLGNNTVEGGANAGSDAAFQAFADDGNTIIAVPISIKRSTGVCTFSSAIVNGPSDRSLKENIAPIDDALAKVAQLQGVSFNMIGDETKRRQIGLIAQDVAPVVPEVLQNYQTGDDEPKLALDYPKLTALLVEAVKELSAKIVALEAKAA